MCQVSMPLYASMIFFFKLFAAAGQYLNCDCSVRQCQSAAAKHCWQQWQTLLFLVARWENLTLLAEQVIRGGARGWLGRV